MHICIISIYPDIDQHLALPKAIGRLPRNSGVPSALAVRWWVKNNNYHQFVPITIQHSIAQEQLEAVEATYIQRPQPKLNHPHIAPHMRRSLRFIHRQGHSKATGFRSIWAKIRRKRLPPRMQDIHNCHTFTSQVGTWPLLCDLSSNTKRRFESIRSLLQSKTSTTGIYGLCRMAGNLSNVHKQAAQKALKVVLRKRRLLTPKPSKPIFAQPLMHPVYTANLRTFLKQAIHKHKDHITPFFIPSTRPVFTKHRTMKDIIHNWREAHRRWHPDPPRSMHLRAVPREIPGQPWAYRHRTQQSGPRHAMSGVLGEIQCASRPENIDVAAP